MGSKHSRIEPIIDNVEPDVFNVNLFNEKVDENDEMNELVKLVKLVNDLRRMI